MALQNKGATYAILQHERQTTSTYTDVVFFVEHYALTRWERAINTPPLEAQDVKKEVSYTKKTFFFYLDCLYFS